MVSALEAKHARAPALVHVAPKTDFVELVLLGVAQVVSLASVLVEQPSTQLPLSIPRSEGEVGESG